MRRDPLAASRVICNWKKYRLTYGSTNSNKVIEGEI
ncbi:hypothetical protein AAZX31_18G241700 [Glycine max]